MSKTTGSQAQTRQSPPTVPKQCTAADLTISLAGEEGTAGTMYRGLVFTNTSGHACTIQGFPRVAFVTGAGGRQAGQAATRAGEQGPAITLKPGEAATAPLGFTDVGALDPAQCRPIPVRGLRVYPPHSTSSKFVPLPATACASHTSGTCLQVMAVHAGSLLPDRD